METSDHNGYILSYDWSIGVSIRLGNTNILSISNRIFSTKIHSLALVWHIYPKIDQVWRAQIFDNGALSIPTFRRLVSDDSSSLAITRYSVSCSFLFPFPFSPEVANESPPKKNLLSEGDSSSQKTLVGVCLQSAFPLYRINEDVKPQNCQILAEDR